jgi:cell division protein FtsB
LYNNEESIEKHIDRLTNDFDYLEFIAYSRFKMVKPGERIFRVKDYKVIN